MREGTTSRVTAADRLYGKFYDFYSVSPENFGSTLVLQFIGIILENVRPLSLPCVWLQFSVNSLSNDTIRSTLPRVPRCCNRKLDCDEIIDHS
jgi:hypothetical protein